MGLLRLFSLVLLLAVGASVISALAVMPAVLSWPSRVRWLVSAQSIGIASSPYWVPFDVRKVAITAVDASDSGIVLYVLEGRHQVAHTQVLSAHQRPTDDMVRRLRDWSMLRTPLLLILETSSDAALSGPVGTVTGLRLEEQTLASDPPGVTRPASATASRYEIGARVEATRLVSTDGNDRDD